MEGLQKQLLEIDGMWLVPVNSKIASVRVTEPRNGTHSIIVKNVTVIAEKWNS